MKNQNYIEARAKQLNLTVEIYLPESGDSRSVTIHTENFQFLNGVSVRQSKKYGSDKFTTEIGGASWRISPDALDQQIRIVMFASEIVRYLESEEG